MKLVLFVCSQSNSIDLRSNQVSIFNILDNVNAPSFPIVLDKISVLAIFSDDITSGEYNILMDIVLNDEVLASGPIVVKFGGHTVTRTFTEIGGLILKAPGDLKFSLKYEGNEIGEWRIKVQDFSSTVVQATGSDDAKENAPVTKRRRRT